MTLYILWCIDQNAQDDFVTYKLYSEHEGIFLKRYVTMFKFILILIVLLYYTSLEQNLRLQKFYLYIY